MHHARYREALALVDALIAEMPASSSLQRQRGQCLDAILREDADALAVSVRVPELIRVDATLFSFDQQRDCNAPAADLRSLGFMPLLDAASPSFSALSLSPVLIRFFGDGTGDSVVVGFSAVLLQRPVRLLACVSVFDDDHFVLTHRDAELPIASNAGVTVCTLAQGASLTELVTRHAGRCAMRLRGSIGLALRPVRSLADCDMVWHAIAGN